MNPETSWATYCADELHILTPILARLGYSLDSTQPHIAGERFLMQAVTTTSGRKLILLGTRDDGLRVVIKATRDPAGIRELAHEQTCRKVLEEIDFAGEVFHTPELVARVNECGFVIMITRFVPQETTFIERPLAEQFSIALRAFKGQESAHATTSKHRTLIAHTFGMRDAQTYLSNFDAFCTNIEKTLPEDGELRTRLEEARAELKAHERTIEQYTGFLTHTDFVPHNIRIEGDTIILLDHSSLTFGNKYEGWARFLNFMTLYNQPLEQALTQYVRDNRTEEESVTLRMMRIYRLGEIIWYYTQATEKSIGNLQTLNKARITFWSTALKHILANEVVPRAVIDTYTATRDALRSDDEKKRQVGLH